MKIPTNNIGYDSVFSQSSLNKPINSIMQNDNKEGSFIEILKSTIGSNSNDKISQGTSIDKIKLQEFITLTQIQMNKSLLSSLNESEEKIPSFKVADPIMGLMNQMPVSSVYQDRKSEASKNRTVTDNNKLKENYKDIIDRAADTFGVDSALISSVIKAESSFNPDIVSPKGAIGLMQLMPETAKDLGVKNPYDPKENIMAGTRYLKDLLDRNNGNIPLSLASYNWGMGNVEKHPEKLPEETREYIDRVIKYYQEAIS